MAGPDRRDAGRDGMKSRRKRTMHLSALPWVVAACLATWGCKGEPPPPRGPLVGKPAPEIVDKVEFWAGAREVELAACRGKPVLLFFWHPKDGGASLAALPGVARLARELTDEGLVTVGLCVLTEGSEPADFIAQAQALRKKYDLPFPLGVDCDADVHVAYHVDDEGTPWCCVVDARGVVAWAGRPGELTPRLLRRFLP